MSGLAPPRLLAIGASDSSGGTGVVADLKTFAAYAGYGMAVITTVAARGTCGVRASRPVEPELIRAQIGALFDDLGADAVKIGGLDRVETIVAVAAALAEYPPLPVVLDPELVAVSGNESDEPALEDLVAALRELLLPRVTLVTANRAELELMLGREASGVEALHAAVEELGRLAGAALVTGLAGPAGDLLDLLFDGERFVRHRHERLELPEREGVSGTLAAAIAAGLGRGFVLQQAVVSAQEYVQAALRHLLDLGSGAAVIDHQFARRH